MHFRSHACVISQMTNKGRTSKWGDLNDALSVSLTLPGGISSREGLPLATSHGVCRADGYRMAEWYVENGGGAVRARAGHCDCNHMETLASQRSSSRCDLGHGTA